jgi:nicotinate phosphoribosyltransferase
MKLSEEIVKATLPGKKRVWRFTEKGKFVKDVISLDEEILDNAAPLLEHVVEKGKIICERPSLDEIRERAAHNLSRLPDKYKELDNAPQYPVEFSDKLVALRERIVERIRKEELEKSPW